MTGCSKLGAENKQGNINKDECQRIMRVLSLKSFESPRKIMIIWLPEYLGNEGNRLLKLIEEPPEGTTFILVAEEQERILNTILSRCQLVRVHPLTDEEVAAGLVARTPLSEEAALAIAQLTSGNLNEALHLASQADDDQAASFLDWMRRCYKGLPGELVEWVNDFAGQGRENQKHFSALCPPFLAGTPSPPDHGRRSGSPSAARAANGHWYGQDHDPRAGYRTR
jgi:DNA polymerase-3 subunit delta'